MTNHLIAQKLLEHARMLQGGTHLFRARAYRHAAMVVDGLNEPVAELVRRHGRAGLSRLPGIGDHLAFTLEMLATTGEFVPWSERKVRQRSAA